MHNEVKISTSHGKFMTQLGQEPISSRTGLVPPCCANYTQQLSYKEEALEGTSVFLMHLAPHKGPLLPFLKYSMVLWLKAPAWSPQMEFKSSAAIRLSLACYWALIPIF